jgi:hypothetical protein
MRIIGFEAIETILNSAMSVAYITGCATSPVVAQFVSIIFLEWLFKVTILNF